MTILANPQEPGKGAYLFTFVHISDTHFNDPQYGYKTLILVDALNALVPRPAFVLLTGDLNVWDDASALAFKGVFSKLEMPVFFCPGNHDIGNKISEWWRLYPPYGSGKGYNGSLYSEEARLLFGLVTPESLSLYEKHFGRSYYSFDYKGCHFISINSPILNSGYEEDRAQMEWLRKDVEEAAERSIHVFLFTHYILKPGVSTDELIETQKNAYYIIEDPASKEITELMERYRVSAVLMGHLHVPYVEDYKATKLISSCGTSFHPSYRLIHVYEEGITVGETIFVGLEVGKLGNLEEGVVTSLSPGMEVFGFEQKGLEKLKWKKVGEGILNVSRGVLTLSGERKVGVAIERRGNLRANLVEFRMKIDTLPPSSEEKKEFYLTGRSGGPVIKVIIYSHSFYYFRCWNSTEQEKREFKLPDLTQTDWHIYRVTVDGERMRFYLDGKEVLSMPDRSYITSLRIGVNLFTFHEQVGEGVNLTFDWIKLGLVTTPTPSPTPKKPGESYPSLLFDGVNDYVNLGDIQDFGAGESFTISIWAKSGTNNRELVEKGGDSSGCYNGYVIGWGTITNNKASFVAIYGRGNTSIATSTTSVTDGVWHNVVAVRDGTTGKIKIAIDGVVENQVVDKNGDLSNFRNLYIGANNNPSLFFKGEVRDVRIWDHAITNSSIALIYDGTYSNMSGLVLHLPMDEGEGSTVYDKSGNGYYGAIIGATWSTYAEPAPTPTPSPKPIPNLIAVVGVAIILMMIALYSYYSLK